MDGSDDNDEIFVEVGGCQALLEVKANQCVLNVKTRPWTELVLIESIDEDFAMPPTALQAKDEIKFDEGGESVGSSAYTEVHHPSGYDRVRMSLFGTDCRSTALCPVLVLCVCPF